MPRWLLRVIVLSGIVIKGVSCAFVDHILERLAIFFHCRFDGRNAAVDAGIVAAIVREHGSIDIGHIFKRRVGSDVRHRRKQFGDLGATRHVMPPPKQKPTMPNLPASTKGGF